MKKFKSKKLNEIFAAREAKIKAAQAAKKKAKKVREKK